MKFVDNNGNIHETYTGTIYTNIKNKLTIGIEQMKDFINSKLTGCKEAEEISMDDDWRNYDPELDNEEPIKIDDKIDNHLAPNNITSITPIDRDNIFVPGTTPKIKRDKNHKVSIDINNQQILIADKSTNDIIYHINIDPRLNDLSVKDLINMIYEE